MGGGLGGCCWDRWRPCSLTQGIGHVDDGLACPGQRTFKFRVQATGTGTATASHIPLRCAELIELPRGGGGGRRGRRGPLTPRRTRELGVASVRRSVINALRRWLKEFFYDFQENRPLLDRVNTFIDTELATCSDAALARWADQLRKIVADQVGRAAVHTVPTGTGRGVAQRISHCVVRAAVWVCGRLCMA